MNFVRKVRLLFTLDKKWLKLFLEAFILLGWARIQKCRSFLKVSQSLGEKSTETSYSYNEIEYQIARRISESINLISEYTFWESQCLVKAMAAMKMLEKRNIESTLYLGTSKDERGKLIAHAWLRTGPFYITGFDGKEKFTVVGTFAKRCGKNRSEKHA
jgi:hypothetical protein